MHTKFFHLQACHRRQKNCIDSLVVEGESVVHEDEKAKALFQFYEGVLGTPAARTVCLHMQSVGLPALDVRHLE